MQGRIRLMLAACCLALMASAVPVATADGSARRSQASPVQRDFFGVLPEDVFVTEGAQRESILAAAAGTGAGTIRQTFNWEWIETKPGVYNFSEYDSYVADVSEHGFKLLPILFNPPSFRSARPAGDGRHGTFPPRSNAEFADFATALVNRYGPSGTFWRERPDLAGFAIRRWQVWNEPNLPAYWPTGPDPRAYTAMLKTVHDAIKAVDPGAEIVTAGLAQSRQGPRLESYLKGMYAAGAKDSFDTLGTHIYARTSKKSIEILEQARKVMRRHRDPSPIWATEFGWASGGPRGAFTVGAAKQAALIAETLREVAAVRQALGIRGVVYYQWKDDPPDPDGKQPWGHFAGLLGVDGQPKPALTAFSSTIERLTRVGVVARRVSR